jgi:hypothetical protein
MKRYEEVKGYIERTIINLDGKINNYYCQKVSSNKMIKQKKYARKYKYYIGEKPLN